MVTYPSLGGFINYCQGFTLLDFPWLNSFSASNLTRLTDTAPSGFLMFYLNLNLASTYLLALAIFCLITLSLTLILKLRS